MSKRNALLAQIYDLREHNNIVERIRFLDICDLQKYKFCKNPQHARLYKIQEYTLDFLYYYKCEKRINNTQWIRSEIKLLEKFLKYLKIQIKISNYTVN